MYCDIRRHKLCYLCVANFEVKSTLFKAMLVYMMVVLLDLFSLDAFLDGMKINYHNKKGFVRCCATDSDEDILVEETENKGAVVGLSWYAEGCAGYWTPPLLHRSSL